jgi:hypothetical protein
VKLLTIIIIALAVFGMTEYAIQKRQSDDATLTPSQKRTLEQRVRDLAMVGQLEYGVLEQNVLIPVVDYNVTDDANTAEAACAHVNGHALYYKISINDRLAAQCFADVMRYTMPHEVGHLLVCQFSEKWREHDAVWANAVRFLGADPQEFHECTK